MEADATSASSTPFESLDADEERERKRGSRREELMEGEGGERGEKRTNQVMDTAPNDSPLHAYKHCEQ